MQIILIAVAFIALLAGCGSSPTEPTVVEPVYPSMLGGWGGTSTMTWISYTNRGTSNGSRTCNETWLVDSQTLGDFSGTYQSGGEENCGSSGTLQGQVTIDGQLTAHGHSTGTSDCTLLYSSDYRGVLSAAGNITVKRTYQQQCFQTIFDVTKTVSLSRR